AGGAVEQLTESPAQETHPAWLPDGERLIFVSHRDGAPALYLLEIDSGEQTRLSLPAPASWPAVSPDGTRLAFAAAPAETGDWDIYEVALDAARPVPDTVRRRTFVAGSDIAPAWRPDGAALAFAGNRGDGLRLFLLELEEELAYSLTEMRASQWAPRWLDGERLLFHAYDGRRLQVYLLDLETGALGLLNRDLDSAAWPAPLFGGPPRAVVTGPEKE
ncbi:MAG: hypothetical protein RQ748_13010, partial [Elusimicrobiales bacterium]|nr:hypothetical protein [Elusimicrobiales bacterium]